MDEGIMATTGAIYIYIYISTSILEIEIPWYNHKELFSTETLL